MDPTANNMNKAPKARFETLLICSLLYELSNRITTASSAYAASSRLSNSPHLPTRSDFNRTALIKRESHASVSVLDIALKRGTDGMEARGAMSMRGFGCCHIRRTSRRFPPQLIATNAEYDTKMFLIYARSPVT